MVKKKVGNIFKYKANVTFHGHGKLEIFLFALNQSIAAYNFTTDELKKLALGRSLRSEALEWWSDNSESFDTFEQASDTIKDQYKDLAWPGKYLCKLNRLTQARTGTARQFFREAERLNPYAKLPEDALWQTLKQGLSRSGHETSRLEPKAGAQSLVGSSRLELLLGLVTKL